MKLEWERVWTKVWLLGGRSDDIKEPGDYICTDIGKESVLIVRQADGSIRAFPNLCLHRGNRLRPEGLGNAEKFQCMYHHWTYGLDGRLDHIPDLCTFPRAGPGNGADGAALCRMEQLCLVLAGSRRRTVRGLHRPSEAAP
ncbi:aromatic ring-hydroxylating oxygenase subunit alpha [Novosphingobium panipatense]|uniref:aromatic ring-hydroxylating oxygenase subunit alpha n=1 Tax=Novosphingobium panipatense TaxID=428991 RepID=UPI0036219256